MSDVDWEPYRGKRDGKQRRRGNKHVQITTYLSETDRDLLEWMTRFVGSSKQEIIRTALYVYAGQLVALEREVTPIREAPDMSGEEGAT